MATVSQSLTLAVQHHRDGRLQEAAAIYRQILAVEPNHADAIHLLGVIAYQTGDHQMAVDYIGEAIALQGTAPLYHNNLGQANRALGRIPVAVANYRRALELQPDYAEAQNNLGNALTDLGAQDEALACYRRALELRPDYADAAYNLGTALQYRGLLDEASACYRRVLEVQPDYADAAYNLGNVFKARGMLDDAVACYRRTLELRPDYAAAHHYLGFMLSEQGKLDEAVHCQRQAIACCQRGSRIGPRSAAVHDVLGRAQGQLAQVLGGRLPEDDLLAMRQLLSEPNLGAEGRIAVAFGLARVLDARGEYAEAAAHLQHANAWRLAELRRQNQEEAPAHYRAFVDTLIANATPQFFARLEGAGSPSEVPVFIVGLPRSGTTLTEQILASHSQVFGAGELPYCSDTFDLLPKAMSRNDTPPACLRDLDRATAGDLARRYADRLQALDQRALRIVDKAPENYHALGLISILFPRARLIHCRRDLRDVALSCWMTNFATVRWSCNPDHIALRCEAYRRLMDHWQKVLPSPVLHVDYEELVNDLEGAARRIVEWCGLEWEPRCLKFHETLRPVQTASSVEVRQPIYKTSVGRWKHYEKSLGDLFSKVQRWNFRQTSPPGGD